MKKITTFALFFLASTLAHAQFTQGNYKSQFFEDFFKSTTYVELIGDSTFDAEMQKTIKRFWKLTPYKFVGVEEFNSMAKKDTKNSFLGFIHQTTDYSGYSNYTSDAITLELFMGCENYPNVCGGMVANNGVAHFTWQKLLSMSGEKTVNSIKIITEYYRLPDIINSMQYVVNVTREDKIKLYAFKDHSHDFVNQVLNKDASVMKTKTLYILKDDLRDDVDLAKAKSNYPYKFKIVTQKEMEKAIISEDKDVVYMANNDANGPSFYDIATHKIIGAMDYGYHVQFRTQDFKDIAAFVKKHSK